MKFVRLFITTEGCILIGLKRGTVALCAHEKRWGEIATETIRVLKSIFGDAGTDMQHVGSTSIVHIMAKPIIDIAVTVDSFQAVLPLIPELERNGFIHVPKNDDESQMFFSCGDFTADTRTHHIHIVKSGSPEWINYINFRDFLNTFPEKAKEYEALKIRLMKEYSNDREAYTEGKAAFITYTLRKALVWSYLGKIITVEIDRPVGYVHKKKTYSLIYPINYGYIPGVLGGDGEELDVYVLGIDKPLREFTGRVIGIVHRENDAEDKLIAAPDGIPFTPEAVEKAVYFQEKYYKTKVEMLS